MLALEVAFGILKNALIFTATIAVLTIFFKVLAYYIRKH